MRRADLQALAEAKLSDAQLLLDNERWGSAYYLVGYSIEFGLKACVARQIASETIPQLAILRGIMTHKADELVALAGLKADLDSEQTANLDFAKNWGLASRWKPDDRYRVMAAIEAQYLVQAIADPENGVLQWIRRFW